MTVRVDFNARNIAMGLDPTLRVDCRSRHKRSPICERILVGSYNRLRFVDQAVLVETRDKFQQAPQHDLVLHQSRRQHRIFHDRIFRLLVVRFAKRDIAALGLIQTNYEFQDTHHLD